MGVLLPKLGQPVWVLLSGILFAHFGTYMLMPFFSIILSTEKGLTLGQVGLVLGANSIAYLIGSLGGGFVSDHLGRKITMVAGLIIHGVGLLGFLWFGTFFTLLATNFVSGFGDGLYMPPAKAGIAAYTSKETKTTAFSYRGIAASIGTTLGPLLGTYLLTRSSAVLFAGAAVIAFAMAAAHVFLLKNETLQAQSDKPKLKNSLQNLMQDRPFLVFSFVTIFVWALFTQFTLSVPLRAEQIHSVRSVGLIWTSTSILVILLQSPMTRMFTKYLHPLKAMALGSALMAVALGTVAFSHTFWHLVGSAILFTLGEMLFMPTTDAIVSDLAKPEAFGSYFGVSAFVYGAGETLGNIGGGRLMETAVKQNWLSLPWAIYGAIGAVVAAAYLLLSYWRVLAKPLTPALAERTSNPSPISPVRPNPDEDKPKAPARKKQKT